MNHVSVARSRTDLLSLEIIKPLLLPFLDQAMLPASQQPWEEPRPLYTQSAKPVRHPTTVRDEAPPALAFLPLLFPAVTVTEERIRNDDTKKRRNY